MFNRKFTQDEVEVLENINDVFQDDMELDLLDLTDFYYANGDQLAA
jgi:hypothetical protein